MSFLADSKGNSLSQVICRNQLTENPVTKILELIDKTKTAISSYLEWSENTTVQTRGSNGVFTRLRHGEKGRLRARELSDQIKATLSLDAKISIIDALLKDKNTRFHQHSLASFLLDELKDMKEINTDSYPKYKPLSLK